ncbi:MAG: hypothetical protein J1F13_05680 [Prevotellaceae bacterium]|nr:hypothetical protein [Prevotellaceae bacterium]
MKKLLFVCSLALLSMQTISAQTGESWIPKHFGVGVGVGTTGVAVDLSTTINRWFGVRVGADIFPEIKINTDLDLGTKDLNSDFRDITRRAEQVNAAAGYNVIDLSGLPNGIPESMDVEGKWSNTTFHFLLDIYPFKNSSWHATTGFYVGGSKLVSVYNKEAGFLKAVTDWNEAVLHPENLPVAARQYVAGQSIIGAELGDYFITPNPADEGDVEANIKVSSFRPYLGIGWGRAVPRKNRIGCQFDMGVQFWNSPKVYAPTYDEHTHTYQQSQLTDDHAGGDGGDVIKIISKISVYPTINFRIVGRFL